MNRIRNFFNKSLLIARFGLAMLPKWSVWIGVAVIIFVLFVMMVEV